MANEDKKSSIINEGKSIKGGVDKKPQTPRPPAPPGQGAKPKR